MTDLEKLWREKSDEDLAQKAAYLSNFGADTLTPEQIDLALQRLRSDQNFTSGALLGLVASVVGAAVWAVVTIATEYQIGFMAIGVGYLVGIAVRIGGKGLPQLPLALAVYQTERVAHSGLARTLPLLGIEGDPIDGGYVGGGVDRLMGVSPVVSVQIDRGPQFEV